MPSDHLDMGFALPELLCLPPSPEDTKYIEGSHPFLPPRPAVVYLLHKGDAIILGWIRLPEVSSNKSFFVRKIWRFSWERHYNGKMSMDVKSRVASTTANTKLGVDF